VIKKYQWILWERFSYYVEFRGSRNEHTFFIMCLYFTYGHFYAALRADRHFVDRIKCYMEYDHMAEENVAL